MWRILVFIAGLAGLALTAFLTLYLQGRAIESDLRTRVSSALAAEQMDWAYVQAVDGRDVVLGGSASSPEARARAVEISEAVWGVRSVTSLISVAAAGPPRADVSPDVSPDVTPPPAAPDPGAVETAPLPPPAPATDSAADSPAEAEIIPPPPPAADPADAYEAKITWRAGRLTLAGSIPSQAEREALVALARERFAPGEIIDQLAVTPGVPDGAWPDVLTAAVTALAQFTTGEVRLKGRRLALSGSVPGPDVREAALRMLRGLPASYQAVGDVAVAGAGPQGVVETGVGPEAQAADACQAAADAVTRDQPQILFASASSEITSESGAVLLSLAEVFKTCPQAQIEIQGHTDTTGRPETNARLSLDRAEAVRAALIAAGLPRGRLSATGLGAQRPLAAETGPEDEVDAARARNRRIEFVVR